MEKYNFGIRYPIKKNFKCFYYGCKKGSDCKKHSKYLKNNSFEVCQIEKCLDTKIDSEGFCCRHKVRKYSINEDEIKFDIGEAELCLEEIFFIVFDRSSNAHLIVKQEDLVDSIIIYGPIIAKNIPSFCNLNYNTLYKKNIYQIPYTYDIFLKKKNYITIIKSVITIQNSWRKCRYNPEFKMCARVQLRDALELGAISKKEFDDYVEKQN